MLVLAWLIFAFASVIGLLTTRWIGGERSGRCGGCGYDLIGLSESARCPECGGWERELTGARNELVFRRGALRVWMIATVVLTLTSALSDKVLLLEYLSEGFSITQAIAGMRVRHGLPAETCTLAVPLEFAAALLPLVARLDSWMQWRATRVWLGLGLLMCLLQFADVVL